MSSFLAEVVTSAILCLFNYFILLYLFPILLLLDSNEYIRLVQSFDSGYAKAYTLLLIFRYLRLVVGIFGYLKHRSAEIPRRPTYSPADVTTIIPTVPPFTKELENAVHAAVRAGCAQTLVVVPHGLNLQIPSDSVLNRVSIRTCAEVNKRHQLCVGLREASTSIIIFNDDHSEWPSPNFLQTILAPFEDPDVGGVAMSKRVRRSNDTIFSFQDLCNFIACLYLERHNFDLQASHGTEGSVFVISGRTAAYRASILCDPNFISAFCSERWFFDLVGPLNADDDNFITRWLVKNDWKIGFQHGISATTETTLGISGFTKFNRQCQRWARTTWRSNSTTLLADRNVWASQPWSVYAIYITSFLNFALLIDPLLIYLCYGAGWSISHLLTWILLTKIIKSMPHFLRHPRDIVYFPAYLLFGYYHSLVKLYALFTVLDVSWGSRPGIVS